MSEKEETQKSLIDDCGSGYPIFPKVTEYGLDRVEGVQSQGRRAVLAAVSPVMPRKSPCSQVLLSYAV